MKNLVVGTWNVENPCLFNRKNNYKADVIIDLLMIENINIFGLQGVSTSLYQKIKEKLKKLDDRYNVVSSYNKEYNTSINFVRQNNLIISNLPCCQNRKVIDLPWFPSNVEEVNIKDLGSIRPRNITIQSFLAGGHEIRFHNTQLDYKIKSFNKEQFEFIYEILVHELILDPTVEQFLLGSLNMTPNSQNMKYYKEILDAIRLQILDLPKCKLENDTKKDYLIYPKDWIVNDICIYESDKNISTHNPIIAKVKK